MAAGPATIIRAERIELTFVYRGVVREVIVLVGGPADSHVVDIPTGQDAVRVVLLTDERSSWVEVADQPRGGISGLVVSAGAYRRTDWSDDGKPVFRFIGSP